MAGIGLSPGRNPFLRYASDTSDTELGGAGRGASSSRPV